MNESYTQAIETRAHWLRIAESELDLIRKGRPERIIKGDTSGEPPHTAILPRYVDALATGTTYFMNKNFCKLVDHARNCAPDDLKFEANWLLSKSGWLYVDEPFIVPELVAEMVDNTRYISAVGWLPIQAGTKMFIGVGTNQIVEVAKSGITQFLFFGKTKRDDFSCWSYLSLRDGDALNARIVEFENRAGVMNDGKYADCTHRAVSPLHEVRWLYCALHLMAQKFSMAVEHKPERASIRRAQREGRPEPPWIKVITLRRMEEARKKDVANADVNWKWQWEVSGHWRNQWYPTEGIHKRIFVDSYTKGPSGLPFKESGMKLFAAVR